MTTTGDVHLLENYGPKPTKTLCGLAVPMMVGSERGNIRWAHRDETCPQCCQSLHNARIGQLAGSPLPPAQKANPLGRAMKTAKP